MEALQTLATDQPYPNPRAIPPAVIDLRVHKHEDSDFAVMAIVEWLSAREWRILRYDADLEQGYCHLQAKRYDMPRVGLKEIAVNIRDAITDGQNSPLCWVVIESMRGAVRVNWEGVKYDLSGEMEQP